MICMHCSQGEVEDVYHWMMRCTAWTEGRTRLMEEVNCMIDVPNLTDEEVAEYIMDRALYQLPIDEAIRRDVEREIRGMIAHSLYVCLTLIIGCMYVLWWCVYSIVYCDSAALDLCWS